MKRRNLCTHRSLLASATLALIGLAATAHAGTFAQPAMAVATTPCSGRDLRWHSSQTNVQPENGMNEIFGSLFMPDGSPLLPPCERSFNARKLTLPVLLVDWEDFNPVTDRSNPGNPASVMPTYVPTTAQTLQEHLNGPAGPATYYRDVSGGKVALSFEVVGWLRSDAPGSYLKPRSAYLQQDATGNWSCDRNAIAQDALRDAIVHLNKDFRRYDSEQGLGLNSEGFIDGFVLVYEGGPGLCNGTNMGWAGPSNQLLELWHQGQATQAWGYSRIDQMLELSDANHGKLSTQRLFYGPLINVPERNLTGDGNGALGFASSFTWAHELGHLLLGFPDHYYSHHNFRDTVLSGGSNADVAHPAAWEKWFYGRWITPTDVTASGTQTLQANEIGDNSRYDKGNYLLRVPLGDSPYHFLTVEHRWLKTDGNDSTRWQVPSRPQMTSGVLIMEHDWREPWISPAQLKRHPPARETTAFTQLGHLKGEVFFKCFAKRCVRMTPTSDLGSSMQVDIVIADQTSQDRDGDGVSNDNDAFPDDPQEWLDTDKDGTGNNADTDDDNDGIADTQDAFPLDKNESVDTDKDGTGNNTDTDDDNDGVPDTQDTFPLDKNESVDTDKDGTGNNTDTDDDNDGVLDTQDAFPLDPARSKAEPSPSSGGGGGAAFAIGALALLAKHRRHRQE